MFSNIRSYLSRFSSFILFVLMIFAVGVLLVLAIGAAKNGSSSVDNHEVSVAIEEPNSAHDKSAGNSEKLVDNRSAEADKKATVGLNSTDNPKTPPSLGVDSSSQDSMSAEKNNAGDDKKTTVVSGSTATDTTPLPNTGMGEVVLVTAGLMIVVASFAYWSHSRKTLNRQLLISTDK